MSFVRRWWWLLPLLLVVAAGIFVAWALIIPAPMPEAQTALRSDSTMVVTTDRWLVFQQANTFAAPMKGLVIYPGGRVPPAAYAPAARALALRGYLVVIVPMPLNLAVFAPDAAAEVIASYPWIRSWAVGGHSLGGAMAARFAFTHPGAVKGLVLWAAYPANDNNLSSSGLAVLSLYGTLDGLATGAKIDASRPLLPPTTRWLAIEGGNHAGFGWYGPQDGDNPATITHAAQHEQIVLATAEFLTSLP